MAEKDVASFLADRLKAEPNQARFIALKSSTGISFTVGCQSTRDIHLLKADHPGKSSNVPTDSSRHSSNTSLRLARNSFQRGSLRVSAWDPRNGSHIELRRRIELDIGREPSHNWIIQSRTGTRVCEACERPLQK